MSQFSCQHPLPIEPKSPVTQPGCQGCRKLPAQKLSVSEDDYRHFQAWAWTLGQRRATPWQPVSVPGSQHWKHVELVSDTLRFGRSSHGNWALKVTQLHTIIELGPALWELEGTLTVLRRIR